MKIYYKGVCIHQVWDKGVKKGEDRQFPWYERQGCWKWAPGGDLNHPLTSVFLSRVKNSIDYS